MSNSTESPLRASEIEEILRGKHPNSTKFSETEVQKLEQLVYKTIIAPGLGLREVTIGLSYRASWEHKDGRIHLKLFGAGRSTYGYSGPASYKSIKITVSRGTGNYLSHDYEEKVLFSRSVNLTTVLKLGDRVLSTVVFFMQTAALDAKTYTLEEQKITKIKSMIESIRQDVNWIEVTSRDGETFDLEIRGCSKSQATNFVKLLKEEH